jgi:hypothetical protein
MSSDANAPYNSLKNWNFNWFSEASVSLDFQRNDLGPKETEESEDWNGLAGRNSAYAN